MARLDFLWQLQARDEKLDMEALQGSNRWALTTRKLAFEVQLLHFQEDTFQSSPLSCSDSFSG